MHALPPVEKSLWPTAASHWLPPIRFEMKPYLEFSRAIDEGLSELQLRYPTPRPLLTVEDRKKILKRKPR
jgi:hypothetical protein